VIDSNSIVFLSGEYKPLASAMVSVMDRGFLFGDGVYEVIPVFGNSIFRKAEHLARLDNSLSSINIRNPYNTGEWEHIFDEILKSNASSGDRALYVQVTRGTGEREHLYSELLEPTAFVMCKQVPERNYGAGISVVTHEDIRWQYCHIKAITLLANVLMKQYALQTDGSEETILIRDGVVTEGSQSNVFIVNNGVISTPEKDQTILPGITRDLAIELIHTSGIPFKETEIRELELNSAEEIWIMGSTIGIAPVIKLNGNPVGVGVPGKLWLRINGLYEEFKAGVSNQNDVSVS